MKGTRGWGAFWDLEAAKNKLEEELGTPVAGSHWGCGVGREEEESPQAELLHPPLLMARGL